MAEILKFYLVLFLKIISFSVILGQLLDGNDLEPKHETSDFVFWPNATIPFFIDPEHFDNEQALSIMTSLSLFAYKTCLKFAPVLARPKDNEHVMVFENRMGVRHCSINTEGHSIDEPHLITLGYECLKTPNIEMMVMNALGYPFEHNRAIRNIYIEVQQENIEPGNMELFTLESKLPEELRVLPYDPNSVLHFDERAFSKNGHRTIIFKDHKTTQCRKGLSELDVRKIDIVYGPECLKRDRQEKIELCQNYPGVARRKREAHSDDIADATKSLRVNPDITPPPILANNNEELTKNLKELGIEDEVQIIVDEINKVSATALKNARGKYCNETKKDLRSEEQIKRGTDILGIVTSISEYAKNMVENAVGNLTVFCEVSQSLAAYQRQKAKCPFFEKSRCQNTFFRSTKSGPVKHSTQHRPVIKQSTKHLGSYNAKKSQFDSQYRAHDDNSTNNATGNETSVRRKRDTLTVDDSLTKRDNLRKYVYRRKRSDVHVDEETEVKRNKRETNATETTVANKAVADEKVSGNVAESVTKSITEASVAIETTLSVNNTKGDLRMGNTPRPVLKKVLYAPNDRREMDGRRFRPLKHNHPKNKQEVWENSSISKEGKKAEKEDNQKTEESDDDEEVEDRPKEKNFKKGTRETEGLPLPAVQYLPPPLPPPEPVDNLDVEEVEEESSEEDDSSPGLDFIPVTIELSKKNKEFYNDRKWPEGAVFYMIKEDPSYDMIDVRARLDAVNRILRARTCVRIKEIKESDANKYEDFLVLNNSPDYVTGRVGGRQQFGVVELLQGGQHKQHTAMMLMAMLGFYFEVSRHDRDKYIRVHNRHIRADKLHHFEKIRSDATFDLPYDYNSATHPAWQFWRHIGKTGISTVATFKRQDPDGSIMKSLGQNENLFSDLDIIKINSVYGIKCFRPKKPKVKDTVRK